MHKAQKEGVLIVTVSIYTLLALALFTKYWNLGFDEATIFIFNGFLVDCEYSAPGCHLIDSSFKQYIYEVLAKPMSEAELFSADGWKSGLGAAIAGKMEVLKTTSSAHHEYYATSWNTATLASSAARTDP